MQKKKIGDNGEVLPDKPPTTFKLTAEQKERLWTKYPNFLEAKANRGTKLLPNGQKFVTTTIVPEFMSKWHTGLTGNAKKDIVDRADYVSYLTLCMTGRSVKPP